MLPGKAKILTCPFCGEKKEVMTVLSYNTFGAVQWSDMKVEMDFNIDVSPVQKCPKCRKYYFEHLQKGEEGESESFELGTLTYPEALDAVYQLLSDNLDDESEKILYITFLHAYNDWFVRYNEDNKHIETRDDIINFYGCIGALLDDALKDKIQLDPIFIAELMRELGCFDLCLDFLKEGETALKDQTQYLNVINQIKEHAKNKDKKVFILGQ